MTRYETPTRLGGVREPAGASSGGRLPDFLIVGACKAGTTTLWMYLREHPSVHLLEPKEPDFFSKDDLFVKGLDWYRSLFASAPEHAVCGEASTTYSRYPHFGDVPGRIHDALPDVKLIYMLREPVSRAHSHYCHRMRFAEPCGFAEAIERDAMFVDCSMYMTQIERFLARFPRNQLLPVLLDDLKADPAATLERVQRFLGLEPRDLTERGEIVSNNRDAGENEFVRKHLVRKLTRVPGLSAVKSLVPKSLRDKAIVTASRMTAARKIDGGYQPEALTPELARSLAERFEEPNRRLGEFLDRDLSHWTARWLEPAPAEGGSA
ncbi:MAG: sulfotransferase domain-containing protein [Planctomycetota bacterium]